MKTAYVQRHLGFASGVYRPADYVAADFIDLAAKLGEAVR